MLKCSYNPKGIIPISAVEKLEIGSPLANEFAHAVKNGPLHEKDAREVASGVIKHTVDTKGGNKDGFIKFLEEHNSATIKPQGRIHTA